MSTCTLYDEARKINTTTTTQQQSYNTTTSTASSYVTDHASILDSSSSTIETTTEETAETAEEAMRQELQIWRRLRHPNILPLLDFFESPMALYAVSPRCPNGSLYHALRRFRKHDTNDHDNYGLMGDSSHMMSSYSSSHELRGLDVNVTRQIVAQLASAVRYLHHDAAVVHGDLKLENVLINAAGHVQIIDFGLSRELFDEGTRNDSNSSNNNKTTTTTIVAVHRLRAQLQTTTILVPQQVHCPIVHPNSFVIINQCHLPLIVGTRCHDLRITYG
ncbi:kinase-like domain-containing protein [Syncephalis plumigaleata]|nr:kinase-like domain-containing protein [Syncephalis plumigaleata]